MRRTVRGRGARGFTGIHKTRKFTGDPLSDERDVFACVCGARFAITRNMLMHEGLNESRRKAQAFVAAHGALATSPWLCLSPRG